MFEVYSIILTFKTTQVKKTDVRSCQIRWNRTKNRRLRTSNTQLRTSNGVLFKKSEKWIQSSKQKRQIAPDKLKRMHHVFTTISNSQSSKITIFLSLKYEETLRRLDLNTQISTINTLSNWSHSHFFSLIFNFI
jgi:hypothetical protein